MDRVPRQLLLLLKMSDCLRHLDRALGATVNTHVVTAHACADALIAHELAQPGERAAALAAYSHVKARLWAYDWLTQLGLR